MSYLVEVRHRVVVDELLIARGALTNLNHKSLAFIGKEKGNKTKGKRGRCKVGRTGATSFLVFLKIYGLAGTKISLEVGCQFDRFQISLTNNNWGGHNFKGRTSPYLSTFSHHFFVDAKIGEWAVRVQQKIHNVDQDNSNKVIDRESGGEVGRTFRAREKRVLRLKVDAPNIYGTLRSEVVKRTSPVSRRRLSWESLPRGTAESECLANPEMKWHKLSFQGTTRTDLGRAGGNSVQEARRAAQDLETRLIIFYAIASPGLAFGWSPKLWLK
ncbi:hypothetical protein C8R44DRAFT_917538 [Mycena epipterygia]|nr:hypothetical protein C8R44DRAFT_917538 [Mycena epipterygia]